MKTQRRFLAQSTLGAAFTYLTTGVFLSGLALLMGAGDVLVSYISVISNLCGVLLLFFPSLLERFSGRKKPAMVLTALTKACTVFLAAIPALLPAGARLYIFLPAMVLAFTLQAQTTVVLNQWLVGTLAQEGRGKYISLRQTLTLAATVVLSLGGGVFLDAMEGAYLGFVLVFSAALLLGVAELLLLLRIPDVPAPPAPPERSGLWESLRVPLGDRGFMAFVVYVMVFYLLLNVADSFSMVYMLRYLELPYRAVTAFQLLMSLPQLFLLRLWGKLSDRKGHRFALRASVWVFAGETLAMVFSSPGAGVVFVPLAFLIASVANAGFNVAVFNRRYELMPAERRIAYDNLFTAAVGLGVLLGPLLGGGLRGLLARSPLIDLPIPFVHIRALYLIATVGILTLQVLAGRATKPKPVTPRQ